MGIRNSCKVCPMGAVSTTISSNSPPSSRSEMVSSALTSANPGRVVSRNEWTSFLERNVPCSTRSVMASRYSSRNSWNRIPASICHTDRSPPPRVRTFCMPGLSFTLRTSAIECAGSVEIRTTFALLFELICSAYAVLTVVLPTPPLPKKKVSLVSFDSLLAISSLRTER